MELKQRKRINNLSKFEDGKSGPLDTSNLFKQSFSINKPVYTSGTNTGKINVSNNTSNFNLSTGDKVQDMRNSVGSLSFIKPQASAGSALGNVNAGTVSQAVNGTLGVISGFNQQQAAVKGQSGLFGMSGQRTDQAFGVNYQAQNDIDKSQAMADISASNTTNTLAMTGSGAAAGAAVGTAIVPGIGSLIGGAAGAITGLAVGLFGGKKAREKQRKKIQNAQQNANLINQVNRSAAASEGLQQQYYMDNGTTYDDLLYANRGKDLKRPRYDKGK